MTRKKKERKEDLDLDGKSLTEAEAESLARMKGEDPGIEPIPPEPADEPTPAPEESTPAPEESTEAPTGEPTSEEPTEEAEVEQCQTVGCTYSRWPTRCKRFSPTFCRFTRDGKPK